MNKTLLTALLLVCGLTFAFTTASAQRLLTKTEACGNGYDQGVDQVSNTEYYFYDASQKMVRSNKIALLATGGTQLSEYYTYTYDDNGNLVEKMSRKATPTSADNVDNEYTFVDGTRCTTEYNDKGQKVRYYESMWQKSMSKWSNSKGYEWEYDENGRMSVQREYYQYNPDPEATNNKAGNTTTYTYDANGKMTKAHNDGTYDSNKWESSYTYDADGNLIEDLRVIWSQNNKFNQRIVYTYANGMLTEEVKTVLNTKDSTEVNSSRTVYELVNGDPNIVRHYTVNWNKTTNDWASPSRATIDYYYDFTGKDEMAPQLMVYPEDNAVDNLQCAFMVHPDAATANARYDLYRDGYLMVSKTVSQLTEAGMYDSEAMAACIMMNKQPAGVHDYYVQLMWPEGESFKGCYTSNVVTYDVAINLPAVSNLKVTNIVKTTQEGVDQYDVTVSWDNPANLAELGFKRHNFFVPPMQARFGYEESATATSYTVVGIEKAAGTIRMTTDYNQGSAEATPVAFDYAEFSKGEPVPAYGFMMTWDSPWLAKINVNDPAADYETLWTLDENIYEYYYGCSAGDAYYGVYGDDMGNYKFAALNFQDQAITDIATLSYGTDAFNITDMTYDEANKVMYAASSHQGELDMDPVLMTVEPNSGTFTTTATLDRNITLVAAMNGTLYGAAQPDYTNYQLYEIDPATGVTTEIVFATPLATGSYDSHNLVGLNGKLYLTEGKELYEIDPSAKTWVKKEEMKRAIKGLTFQFAAVTPDINAGGTETEKPGRTLTLTTTYGDTMGAISTDVATGRTANYYNAQGKLAYQIETASSDGNNWNLLYFTTHNYNADGDIESIVRQQYGLGDYGIMGLQTVSTKNYLYNEEAGVKMVRENDGDDWTESAYQNGLLMQQTIGVGQDEDSEDVYQSLYYQYYEEGPATGKVMMVNSVSPMHPEWDGNVYCDFYEYDADGKLVKKTRYTDNTMITVRDYWTYSYFEGTDILSVEERFDAEDTPEFRSTYTPVVEGDYSNVIKADEGYYSGQWIKEVSAKTQLTYTDFDKLPSDACNLNVAAVAGQNNIADVAFTVPAWAMVGNPFRFDIYRDGEMVAQLGQEATETYDGEFIHYFDEAVRNGDHNYFVQPCIGSFDDDYNVTGYTPLYVTNNGSINFNLALPAVTNLAITAERNETVRDPQTGANYQATVATLTWTNPEGIDDLKFESNNVFLDNYQLPTNVVTEGATADVNLGENPTEVTLMVQSRYAYGYVNSEALTYHVGAVGINGSYAADGLKVNIANKVATVNKAAAILVFDAAGRLVAQANGKTINLNSLTGTHILMATTAEGKKLAVKVTL